MRPSFRKLLPYEYADYESHLLRLSAADRAARFHAGLTDEAIRRHCRKLRWPTDRLIGCFADGDLRGAVELRSISNPDAPVFAELAVSVEGSHQGQGAGTELVRRALLVARNRAMPCVAMTSLPNNGRMLEIGRRFDGRSSLEDDSIFTDYRLDRPDAASILQELADDGIAFLFAGVERWQRSLAVLMDGRGQRAVG